MGGYKAEELGWGSAVVSIRSAPKSSADGTSADVAAPAAVLLSWVAATSL
jgi:hypothetical protein